MTPAIICHCCNDKNKWGRGFVLALRAKYPASEKAYHDWFEKGSPRLGGVQFVPVAKDIDVANLIGQHDNMWQGDVPPIRYNALEEGLDLVYATASKFETTVHLPRIGADLAGGHWPTIEGIIRKTMTVDTFVYTLESQKDRWPTEYDIYE